MSTDSYDFEDLEDLEEDEAAAMDEVPPEPESAILTRRIFTDKLDPKVSFYGELHE